MNALVIGLGSMGRRRIRLLRVYDSSITVIGVDSRHDRCDAVESEFGIRTYSDIEKACTENKDISVAIVSTSPRSHAQIISDCLNRKLHVFSEINLVDDDYDKNISIARANNRVLFMSSTFMYRKEIEYIKKEVLGCGHNVSYMYHVGQYLPDWHPWENYKDFFVSDSKTNGCREIMAIEFPWIFDIFGIPTGWSVQSTKLSSLELDYPDMFQVMFTHEDGTKGIIQIDIVSRKAVRNFECVSEEMYIAWDGTPDGISRFNIENNQNEYVRVYDRVDKLGEYSSSIIEDAYLAEISDFMSAIQGITIPRYSFEKDKAILNIINSIGA